VQEVQIEIQVNKAGNQPRASITTACTVEFRGGATSASPFFRTHEPVFREYWKAGANWPISAACQRQASAIFAATIVSESQHATTATRGGKYAKQK
jgi:hypothetical protein